MRNKNNTKDIKGKNNNRLSLSNSIPLSYGTLFSRISSSLDSIHIMIEPPELPNDIDDYGEDGYDDVAIDPKPYDDDGRLTFSISPIDMGFCNSEIVESKECIFSAFFANTIGELIVRENIKLFSTIFMGVTPGEYIDVVNNRSHKGFGLSLQRNRFKFSFHLSLIQSILTEEFKKIKTD
jgi:hypothetical protein